MSVSLESVFPDCFPPDFQAKILPPGLSPAKFPVYRLCLDGILNREAFLSTYELTLLGKRPKGEDWDEKLKDPETYSTSCYIKLNELKQSLKTLRRYHPSPIIVYGTASSAYGPLQKSKERTGKKTSHVDWWLYKNADPSGDFSEIEVSK